MFLMSEVIDAMKKWENSLVRGTPRMLGLFLGVTFVLASTALAECPDVGISAQASDRSTWPRALDLSSSPIILDFPLLLDRATPRLPGIKIVAGGRLVFSPSAHDVSLTADFIQIEDGGSLEIGSSDCPFEGRAEILLTGKRGSYNTDNGEKFIAVEAGGRLEIHGQQRRSWTQLAATVRKGRGPRRIEVLGDVSSWRRGDKLVIASTDGVNNAEEVFVERCDIASCNVSGRLRFDHFGEVDSGVEMRAEVGLLSRNVVIRGEMESSCYPPNPCEEVTYDTFGGHIIAKKDFSTFRVEHAELRQMGQLGIIGRYPLHWHMADQLVAGDSYVANNSIHDTMQRCVTCHGSFGCLIEDNVAYEHLGHCYFLEDGVEKDTVLRGNLGLGTRRTRSSTIPSDKDPATFWVTHPTALVTGNHAAGSEGKGFWFLQARLPTGAAGRRQAAGNFTYFEEGELFRTALRGISGNTAHSSAFGFFFDKVLQPDQGAGDSGKFDPREDPKDPRSPRLRSEVTDLTCYKSMATCLWFQFSDGQFSRLKVADSREGMFSHDDTIVTESIFVAESSNFPLDRRGRIRKVGRFGFRNYLNPALLSGVSFKGFTGGFAEGGSLYALGLRRVGGKSLYTGGSNLSFPETPFEGRIGEHKNDGRQFLYRDWTGSITSSAGSYLVSDLPHMVSSQCSPASPGLKVCPHPFYSISVPAGQVELTRLDITDSPFIPMDKENFLALSTAHTNMLSFPNGMPMRGGRTKKVFFKLHGADIGTSLELAVCVPMDSTLQLANTRSAESFSAFKAAVGSSVYFHDKEHGLLWLRVVGDYQREQGDYQPCGNDDAGCFNETIKFQTLGSDLSTDCRARPGLLEVVSTSSV